MTDNAHIRGHLRLTRGSFSLDARFDIPATGVTAVFGPSGAGKTTLLRMIAGLERGTEGELHIQGDAWQSANYWRPPHERPVGYVFQEASLFSHLNVEKNLLFGFRRVPPSQRRIQPDEVLSRLGLTNLLQRMPAGLSGGERQRVALGRALLTSPRVLLLDEPMSALDNTAKAEILPYLKSLRDIGNIPIIYVSHSHNEVARLADQLLLMDKGRVRAHGGVEELINRLDSPLTHDGDQFSLLEGALEAQDAAHCLSHLRIGDHILLVPALTAEIGEVVRLRIQARDVSLCLSRPNDSSILNILPVELQEAAPARAGQRLLLLQTGGFTLAASISELSFQRLKLRPGSRLYAQIKSVALAESTQA